MTSCAVVSPPPAASSPSAAPATLAAATIPAAAPTSITSAATSSTAESPSTSGALPRSAAGSSRPLGATITYTTAAMKMNVEVNELTRMPAISVAASLRISSIQNLPRQYPATYSAKTRP